MKNRIIITAAVLAVLTLASCEKSETYPRGGELDMAEDNLAKSWDLSKYYRDGVDETSLVLITAYSEDYTSAGVYSRSYLKADQSEVNEDGAYHFSENMLEIRVSDVSSIAGFSDNNTTLSASAYTILKLTSDELVYSFENGSETHEFRFTRRVSMK